MVLLLVVAVASLLFLCLCGVITCDCFCVVLLSAGKAIMEVFGNAAGPKAWNSFTKPQRKTITQWKEQAMVGGAPRYV